MPELGDRERADGAAARAGFTVPPGDAAWALRQLARVTAELAAADSISAVVEAAVNHAAGAIGAAVTTLMLRDRDQLILVGGHGLQPGVSARWGSFPVAADNPASEAVRLGRPVAVPSAAAVDEQYPSMQGQLPTGRSLLCLPLGSGAETIGALGLTFEQEWLPGPLEADFLSTFADACAQAVRRIQASAQAAERARQLQFLADASLELGRSLDYRATLSRVAELVVPDLADWCTVDILDGATLSTLAVAHTDPDKVAWAWELQKRFPPDRAAPTGAANVVRTGVSEIYERITDEMLVAAVSDEEQLQLLRELALRSALIVPLIARGRTLGAMTLIRTDRGTPYGPADLAVAEDLGRRAGTAIDNAELHSQTRDVALELQRAALPDDLTNLSGWQVVTHYEPGGRAEVGGDFYDAIVLPDGRLAVMVGDVMGHGVPAAAAMAQMRAAVRAFLSIDAAPEHVVDHLQRMFDVLAITQLVSLVYALIDRHQGQLELVNAGALPPVVVGADGRARYVGLQPRRPLGAGPDTATSSRTAFSSNDTLLLYTDGLIERRDEHIDAGLGRLFADVPRLSHADLPRGLRELIENVRGQDGHDDVTALAVRPTQLRG